MRRRVNEKEGQRLHSSPKKLKEKKKRNRNRKTEKERKKEREKEREKERTREDSMKRQGQKMKRIVFCPAEGERNSIFSFSFSLLSVSRQ